MPKRESKEQFLFPITEPGSAKAREKIATLRKYYELGWRASGTSLDGAAKEPEPLSALAEEAGVQTSTIRLALRFATTYTAEELEGLLALRDPAGEPLSWYLVRVLLQVKDKARRADIQARAAKEGWSRRDLWAEVQTRQGGKKSPGGRRFAVPESPHQVLKRLTELSESWLRFYADIGEEGGLAENLRSARRKGKSTAGLKQAAREAADRLRALRDATSKLAARLDEFELRGGEQGQRAEPPKDTKSGREG